MEHLWRYYVGTNGVCQGQ